MAVRRHGIVFDPTRLALDDERDPRKQDGESPGVGAGWQLVRRKTVPDK